MKKTFTTYLNESKKSWKFSIKTIHDLTNDQCDRIEKHLGKYDSKGLGAAKKTILQSAPRDFPNHKGYEVFIHEFECDRIASGWQVQNDIRNMLGLADGVLKVIGEHEPDDLIPPMSQRVESVLAQSEYSKDEKAGLKAEDYYGDKYNSSFIKELMKVKKEKEKGNE
jgi:hypothetical protein|tara:strand:- start:151 stop:651 length:501 start_codon:yes stop_codon:yes gene_type:complete